MLPYIRRIDIGDVHRPLVVVLGMNGQVQYLHMVATVLVNRRVVMQTRRMYKARRKGLLVHAPTNGITFADRQIDGVVGLLPNIDMYVVNTIVTVHGLLAVDIVIGRTDVIQTTPFIRYIVLADVNRIIPDLIGLMDIQGQTVDTVATVNVR